MIHKTPINKDNHASFTDWVVSKLVLNVDGEEEEIFTSNIEYFDINLSSYGFTGKIHFSVFDTEIEKTFFSEKPVEVVFTFQTEHSQKKGEDPIKLKGIADYRESKGQKSDVNKKEKWLYLIHFSDVAKATWSSHYPTSIVFSR